MTIVKVAGTKIGAFKPFQWALTSGFRPFIFEVETEKRAAFHIFDSCDGAPIEVQVGPRLFKQVYVTALGPGTEPGTRTLELRDRRWLWERKETVRRYNIRTKSGTTRLIGEGRVVNKKIDPDIRYHKWSLNNGKPWTFLEAIKELFKSELGINLKVDGSVGSVDRAVDFEDFSESGSVTALAERLMSYARGYNVRLDKDGEVILYDEHDRSEPAELVREKKIIRGSGWRTIADKRYLRPSKIKVLFTREIEVRFDYKPGSFEEEDGREPRRMINVIPVPVREMTLGQTSSDPGAKVAQQTLLTFLDYFATEELTTNLPDQAPGLLSDDRMAQYWNKGASPGSFLRALYTSRGGNVDRAWSIYINAAMNHWRRTFLITRPWTDRMRAMKAERVAIQSFENAAGSRARSPVYCDFTIYPNYNLAAAATKAALNPSAQILTRGYADRLENAQQAPAPEIDFQRGIPGLLRIFLSADPMLDARYVIPGATTQPLLRFEQASTQLTPAILVFAQTELEKDWNLATVVTCIQGAPNNAGQYHEVVVTPQLAEGALKYQLGPCLGPEMTIVIDESPTTTARFFWKDDYATQIEECFYTGGVSPPDDIFENQDDVEELALGAAARIYEFFTDRVQGSFATDLASPGEMTGAIAAHSFEVAIDGVGRKSVSIPALATQASALQYVEASVRRKLQRLVEL